MIRKTIIIPFVIFLLLVGAATAYLMTGNTAKNAPNISIENSVIRLPAPGQTTAGAFFDIVNAGGADELLSATSPISMTVELHTHLHEDGVMKMRKVDSVKIQGLETTHFKSGGLHIMLFDIEIPDDAKSIPITLNFARSGEVHIMAIPQSR